MKNKQKIKNSIFLKSIIQIRRDVEFRKKVIKVFTKINFILNKFYLTVS